MVATMTPALRQLLEEMQQRGVRPTQLSLMAAATDRGLGDEEAAQIAEAAVEQE